MTFSFARAAAFAAILLSGPAIAADLSTKAPLFGSGYPNARCGAYYGVGMGGAAGAVNGAAVGTQIVQGEVNALIGYTCPLGAAGFWFGEASIGVNNINGNMNGLALSGPLVAIQRVGAGSPIGQFFNPFGNGVALPSVPMLPSGVTAGPATSYMFAGLVEQDISVQLGLAGAAKQWIVAPMVGVGMLTRLNGNGVVVDTWAGWQMNSQSFCPGGGTSCGKLGNAARVGMSFKY